MYPDPVRFRDAILKLHNVSFDKPNRVQVFEVNIRILGGLIAAHQYASTNTSAVYMPDYDGIALAKAEDIGNRLLAAFKEGQKLPSPYINLRTGVTWRTNTCTAGAGTLILEFGMLSRLTGDPRFEVRRPWCHYPRVLKSN
jgi:mannosidase alpha-like ER degradation enhancer 1